jgi:small-conductance mechanosensitive channel
MVSNDLMTKLGLDKDMTSAEAFSQYVTGDQKIVDYTNQLSNVNRQIADTSKLINDGIKSLKAKKGDMPADALVVLLNSTFKDVNETLTNLNNTKTYLEADLKNASEMAFNRYNAVSKDIDNARTIKNSVISNLIQSQFNLAEKQTEADLANKIAQEALNDPYKAIPAMIEEYKKLGIPFTRSTQQIIQDFETSGKDLATYLSELQGTIQSKPEYQAYKDKQT